MPKIMFCPSPTTAAGFGELTLAELDNEILVATRSLQLGGEFLWIRSLHFFWVSYTPYYEVLQINLKFSFCQVINK